MNEQQRKFIKSLKRRESDFVLAIFKDLTSRKSKLLQKLNSISSCIEHNDKYDRFFALNEIIIELSYYSTPDVYEAIQSLGLGKHTLPKFIDFKTFFEDLVKHQAKTNYFYSYQLVWPYFKLYSKFFIKDKLALDLDIDLLEAGKKVNRQQRNLSFPMILKELAESIYQFQKSIKKEDCMIDLKLSKKNLFSSMTHKYAYPHKTIYKILFDQLVEINYNIYQEKFILGDFKYEFYYLLEIILRNKTLLNDNAKRIDEKYYNERQHHVVTVNSLLGL